MKNTEHLKFITKSAADTGIVEPGKMEAAVCKRHNETVLVIANEIGNMRTSCRKLISLGHPDPCLSCPNDPIAPDPDKLSLLAKLDKEYYVLKAKGEISELEDEI